MIEKTIMMIIIDLHYERKNKSFLSGLACFWCKNFKKMIYYLKPPSEIEDKNQS